MFRQELIAVLFIPVMIVSLCACHSALPSISPSLVASLTFRRFLISRFSDNLNVPVLNFLHGKYYLTITFRVCVLISSGGLVLIIR